MPGISVSRTCIPFGGGISWSSYWAQQLSRNSDIIDAGIYQGIPASTAYNLATTGTWVLNKNNNGRVRQDGNITKIYSYFTNLNGGSIYFQVWRKDGSNYDLVGEEDIYSKITGEGYNLITLNSAISVLKGDYIAIGGINGTGNRSIAGINEVTAISARLYTGSKPSINDFNYDGATAFTYIVAIKVYMQAPLATLIGDSIVAGHPTNYSFIENSLTVDTTCQIDTLLKAINTLYICQNMGIGSQTSTQIAARFAADVVALKPKIAVINGGVNDIAGGSISKATFLSNYTSMLNACLTNDILPVVCKILPWTNGTNGQMQTRDEWMADLYALVNSETYNGAVWVDFDTDMGKNRATGDAGNLWDLKTDPDYDNDGVHPTALGYAKMAEVINAAIVAKGYTLA